MRIRASLGGVLLIVGFLLAVAATTDSPEREGAESRRGQLIDLIERRRDEVAELDSQVGKLRGEVTIAQQAVARAADLDANQLEEIQDAAGLSTITGSGIEIELNDPSPVLSQDERVAPFQIIDRDLQELTNALWAAGADAIAINDERLVATTAIRNGGNTITVNFRPIPPPYVVVAIGVDAEEFSRSEIATQFKRWSERYGVGFTVRDADELELPAYVARARLKSARPVDKPTLDSES